MVKSVCSGKRYNTITIFLYICKDPHFQLLHCFSFHSFISICWQDLFPYGILLFLCSRSLVSRQFCSDFNCDSRPNWPTWASSRVTRHTFMGPSYLDAPDPIGWHQKSSSLHPYGVIYGVYVDKRCHCLVKKQKTCSCLYQILAILGSQLGPQANFWGSGLSTTTSCSFSHGNFYPGSHIVEFRS